MQIQIWVKQIYILIFIIFFDVGLGLIELKVGRQALAEVCTLPFYLWMFDSIAAHRFSLNLT